jgi:hypothetical protein
MKTLFLLLAMALGLSMMSVGCCADGKVNSKANKPKPVFDREVGRMEKDVVRKYGEPKEIIVKRAKELVGELRSALKAKVPNEDTEVKELYYKTDKRERIFWLTKQSTGEWKVISDVDIPAGVMF